MTRSGLKHFELGEQPVHLVGGVVVDDSRADGAVRPGSARPVSSQTGMALAALHGEDVSWLPDAVEEALGHREPVSAHERWLVAGAGRDWPTAQEAVLKLREGAHVAAEAHHTEQLLHGHLAAVDDSVRAFVLEGEGRAAERAAGAVAALRELGCRVTLVPTVHPVVDIVRFQLLTVDLAQARGVDPDPIRTDEEPWKRARAAYD
jgi:fructoselysine-6-P-deglycase FrlB-like protein